MKALIALTEFLDAISNSFQADKWIIAMFKSDFMSMTDFLNNNRFIEEMYNALISVGIGLLLIYGLNRIIEKSIIQEIVPEDIVRELIKFCILAMFIKNGYQILYTFVNLGNELTENFIVGTVSVGTASSTDLIDAFFNLLASILTFLPNLVFLILCSIPIKLVLLSRTVEIAIYTALAPLALSDIQGNILDSRAFRFLQEYAALALQGVIMVAVICIAERLNINTGNSTFDIFFSLDDLCYAVLIFMLLFKSKKIAKEIIGIV